MKILIIGGGVIGAAIAYFLARRGAEPVIIERTGVACAASGKSGGFLALDWCDGTPLQALARRSFVLHAELAEELGGESWGYRRMTTFGGHASARGRNFAGREEQRGWVSNEVTLGQRLGTAATTAQVHPGLFTQAMVQAAEARGAQVIIGAATGLSKSTDGMRVTGVEVDGGAIVGDAVVIAMGPWSVFAAHWLPLPRVYGLKGHSLVFDTGSDIPAEALFLEFLERNGAASSPEVFPRADGTTYICGISSEGAVPENPEDVAPDAGALERLEAICRTISPRLADANIVARQACFRPVTADGLPMIGRVPGVENAYIAAGHSVWGILNAPATGEALAELILDGESSHMSLAPFQLSDSSARRRLSP